MTEAVDPRHCEHCGKEIPNTYPGRPSHYKKRRFCDRKCSAQWRRAQTRPPLKSCEHCGNLMPFHEGMKASRYAIQRFCDSDCQYAWMTKERVTIECETCGTHFERVPGHADDARYCSKQCLFEGMRNRKTVTCANCGKDYDVPQYRQTTYCSKECMAEGYRTQMQGEANPNYGNRNPGMWTMPAETRLQLSRMRLGKNNPAYVDGKQAGPLRRFHRTVAQWGRDNLGNECAKCGGEATDIHHIVPRRNFDKPIKSHFRQNLIPLCVKCHKGADAKLRRLLKKGEVRGYPFADRLPQSILDQLEQDGSVSVLDPACDYSPLGNIAERVIDRSWFSDKAESPA